MTGIGKANNEDYAGLAPEEVEASRKEYGRNILEFDEENHLLAALKKLLLEPMIVLLLVATSVYFITGNNADGIFMIAAIMIVSTISLFHDARSRNSLRQLKAMSAPHCRVIRGHRIISIPTEDIVMGDHIVAEEGTMIPADGTILRSNDFSVDQSALTGESLSVFKSPDASDNQVFKGTTVISGLAVARVTAIGNSTRLGKVGKSLAGIKEERTPLELQIRKFVRGMMIAGSIVFALVWMMNFIRSGNIADSLLEALTLAMSVIPEEIPVAFTTFMALGAWRLSKLGVIAKQIKTVETLGSATVICTDKTGTLTENSMTIAKIFAPSSGNAKDPSATLTPEEKELLTIAMWASEPIPFDPMERALHEAYSLLGGEDQRKDYRMIHEYPLGGKPPMMTHVFENSSGDRIIAAKGAPEAVIALSSLDARELSATGDQLKMLMSKGYRVLAAGKAVSGTKDLPETQQELRLRFCGLVAFYDPPKNNISKVLADFYAAGIGVKIITGDNAITTAAIAKEIGLADSDTSITGEELMKIPANELPQKVNDTAIFSRMYPEAKMRIIDALKARGQVVAMTGDGINDGPALKASHIGIAMGKKGTEIAKDAASLILLDDDLSKMVEAVAMGRRIYSNLKKAIRYIISIHIPIILTVLMPLALGWIYPNIFSPLHVIFLELIMGPTCSVIYENEPMEANLMKQKPRQFSKNLFNARELGLSIVQGLVIAAGTMSVYYYCALNGRSEEVTRTMVFMVIVSANIFLTLVNRSFYYSILKTLFWKNRLVPLIIAATVFLSGLVLFLPPAAALFGFRPPELMQVLACAGTGLLSVIWFEAVKWLMRINDESHDAH